MEIIFSHSTKRVKLDLQLQCINKMKRKDATTVLTFNPKLLEQKVKSISLKRI
jgi:hypothetical protein